MTADPQSSLFELRELRDYDRSGGLEEKFENFHKANPHVFEALYRQTVAVKRQGWEKCSIKLLFERLRWLWAVQTKGDDYVLNNSYTAYYSRLIMAYDENLKGFFRTRKQRNPYVPDLEALGLVEK